MVKSGLWFPSSAYRYMQEEHLITLQNFPFISYFWKSWNSYCFLGKINILFSLVKFWHKKGSKSAILNFQMLAATMPLRRDFKVWENKLTWFVRYRPSWTELKTYSPTNFELIIPVSMTAPDWPPVYQNCMQPFWY